MISQEQVIEDCKKKVLDDDNITEDEIDTLFNLDDNFLKNLSDAANEITRFFQGKKVDVEQLTNIKKNFCSEDCSFCSQSAFFNTKIDNYKLQPSKEILKQARDAKNNGADSFCLVAAWREPSNDDFETPLKSRILGKTIFNNFVKKSYIFFERRVTLQPII